MLMPKRVKWRKVQRGRMSGPAKSGRTVAFGDFGIATTEPARMDHDELTKMFGSSGA